MMKMMKKRLNTTRKPQNEVGGRAYYTNDENSKTQTKETQTIWKIL